jgi:outer membrane lipoprotein-sorting protein
VACTVLLAASAQAASEGVSEIQECARRNLPEKSSVQEIELRARDRTGSERVLAGKLFWKRFPDDRVGVLMKIDAPPDAAGSSYLFRQGDAGDEMFVYLPELKRVRRIHPNTVGGSLFGTDFSYEDVRYLQQASSEASSERLEDTTFEGRGVHHLRFTPGPEANSSYRRIDALVDNETCVSLEVDFYEDGEEPRKTLLADPSTLERRGRGWIARSFTLSDRRNETSTRLRIDDVEIDGDVPDRLFSVTTLERGR